MNNLRSAETAAEFENLKKEKEIVDRKIALTKAEVAARDEATKQLILAGTQQYDAAQSLGVQMNKAANEAIRRIIAEAVATQIAKVIAMIPWPFNLIAAPIAGLLVQHLIERLIPKFETGGLIGGKRHSSGGTMINAEAGEFIVNRSAASSNIALLESINSGRESAVINSRGNADVVGAIKYLGDEIKRLQVIAKISPREFEESYGEYNIKRNHTG